MQGNTFKTILEQLETGDDRLSGWNSVHGLDAFEAMAVSAAWTGHPKHAGQSGLSSSAHGAYADNDHVREARTVSAPTPPPISLAQLRKKLEAGLSLAALRRLRRQFAFQHHPDRLPATEREAANSRLAMANDLIDLAIQQIGQQRAA